MPRRRAVRGRLGAALAAVALLTFPYTLLLAACSTNVPAPLKSQSQSLASEQTIRVAVPQAPRSLDPALVRDDRELAVVRQFSEPLLKPSTNGRDVQPAAAESFSMSGDGLLWSFKLRANGRYADGQQVRAQDFVLAWRRLIDPRTVAPHRDLFAAVVKGGEEAAALDPRFDAARIDPALDALGLKAADDLTFQVSTTQPAGQLRWIATLPEGGPLRAEMITQPGINGNGPFRVSDASKDRVTLAPNPNYWGGRTTLSRLVISYGGGEAALNRYRDGQLEELSSPPDVIDTELRREITKLPELTVFWIAFNTERAPFDRSEVRQAFAQALDRDAIVNDVFFGRASAQTTLIPRGMRGYRPENGRPQETNPQAARQLLDQQGLPREQLAGLPMIVRDRPFDRDLAGAVATQLARALGVTVSVQPLAPEDYVRRQRAGDFALAGPNGWTADYADQQNFFDLFRSNDGANASRWRSQRYDALVRLADTEVIDDKRDQLYNQAHQLLVQECPVAFVAQRWHWSLVRPHVKGLQTTAEDEWPGAAYSTLLYVTAH